MSQSQKDKENTTGLWIGLVLFTVLIPALFFVAWKLSPTEPTGTPAAVTAEG